MTKNIILTLFVVFISVISQSQSDTLNQVDSDGNKTGWWITYLDKNLEILKDSVGATHCMYNYYTGKFYHFLYGKGLGSKKFPVQFPDNDTLKIGNYPLLHGDYITKYKDGTVRSILTVSNGILIECKKFWPNGQLDDHLIYSVECGFPIRFCIKEYNKKGELTYDGYQQVPKEYR